MFRKLAFLAAAGATLALATPSSAQLYGDPFGDIRPGLGRQAPAPEYQPRPRYRDDRDDRRYDRDYDRRRGRYDDRRGGYYDDGPGYRRGGGRLSDFCATSRGPCRSAPLPVGSNCRCSVDGLMKRGVIQ